MSDPVDDSGNTDESNDDSYVPQGAACKELISGSHLAPTMSSLRELPEISEIEEIRALPTTPRSSPTLPTMMHDFYQPPRRYSNFLTSSDVHSQPNFPRAQRHASLPFIQPANFHHRQNDYDIKKLMFDSSRRSSFESAYHSQRSDPMSRTPTGSRLEFVDDSNNFTDLMFYSPRQSFATEDQIEREIMERRNSLSYEAIRTYFLERNPYIHEIEQPRHCLDHRLLSSSICPNCLRRRSSIGLTNLQFRTNAHQAVIDRQFAELFNIPDQRQSRSTSIDIFGGIDLPSQIPGENARTNQTTVDDVISNRVPGNDDGEPKENEEKSESKEDSENR